MKSITTRMFALAGCFAFLLSFANGSVLAQDKSDEAFAKAKEELTAKADALAKILNGPDFAKGGKDLQDTVKAAVAVKDKFVAEAKGGKDEDKLKKLNEEYAAAVTKVAETSKKFLEPMVKGQKELEEALLKVAKSRPDATQEEVEAVQKLLQDRLEKPLQNLSPLGEAAPVVMPVARLTHIAMRQREAGGEDITEKMQAEEHLRACRQVLDAAAKATSKKK